jgi:hypothetical protein
LISEQIALAAKLKKILDSDLHLNIDHLLSMHPDLATVGKLAIADAILHCEGRAMPLCQQKLYQKIFKIMTSDIFSKDQIKHILSNNITFITFNYDRSLEFYFHHQLQNFADWSKTQFSFENIFMQVIKIYHVYGSLGSLRKDEFDYASYGEQPTIGSLVDSSDRIDVIYGAKDIQNKKEISNAIQNADAVFFLGFGYDNLNLNILNIPQNLKDKALVFGTGVGLAESKRAELNSILKGHGQSSNQFSIGMLNCIDLMDNVVAPYSLNQPINFGYDSKSGADRSGHIDISPHIY